MNNTRTPIIMQRWNVVQNELLPKLEDDVGSLTPKLLKLIYILEWTRIEEFTKSSWHGVGRPPCVRAWLANAFMAKIVLGIANTVGLIERLSADRKLRRICGFQLNRLLPSASTFSRAFEEFADAKLAERVHESLIKEHLGDKSIEYISRDSTAIYARERPISCETAIPASTKQLPLPNSDKPETVKEVEPPKKKRGRPRNGEVRTPNVVESPISRQLSQSLAQMLEDIPSSCDRGTKRNSKGYQTSWNGYKLHIDTADCGVPISVLLSSASTHDSRAAVPLSLMTKARVTNSYDLMDAAYCSKELREHSISLGHIPLIDHNRRSGEKIEFCPDDAIKYNNRTAAERVNARLKDEFGGKNIWVRGSKKVMQHLMFGILVLSADQLIRLRM